MNNKHHPAEFHGEKPKHGHKHMFEVLDGHHEKSIKHEGEAVQGPGGLAKVHVPSTDTRREVFKHGGKVKKHK